MISWPTSGRPWKGKTRIMTRFQFVTYVRGELGRGYSVADDDGGADGDLHLVVLRRGKEVHLMVETNLGWIGGLGSPPSMEDRMLVKHLAVFVKRFFAHPDLLPGETLCWPGTADSRSQVRLALDPRKWRRLTPRAEEVQS